MKSTAADPPNPSSRRLPRLRRWLFHPWRFWTLFGILLVFTYLALYRYWFLPQVVPSGTGIPGADHVAALAFRPAVEIDYRWRERRTAAYLQGAWRECPGQSPALPDPPPFADRARPLQFMGFQWRDDEDAGTLRFTELPNAVITLDPPLVRDVQPTLDYQARRNSTHATVPPFFKDSKAYKLMPSNTNPGYLIVPDFESRPISPPDPTGESTIYLGFIVWPKGSTLDAPHLTTDPGPHDHDRLIMQYSWARRDLARRHFERSSQRWTFILERLPENTLSETE